MIDIDRAAVSQQRAAVYGFLASLFASPLAGADIDRLSAASYEAGDDADSFTADILAAIRDIADSGENAQRLALEHTRLFRGISEEYGPPPPYESLWREGQLMGESTLHVSSRYLEAGYLSDDGFAPCDHLVEELRFMAALCHAESAEGEPTEALSWRRQQRGFIDEHLTAWVSRYCEELAQTSREPLYRALARTTARVVAADATHLQQESGEDK